MNHQPRATASWAAVPQPVPLEEAASRLGYSDTDWRAAARRLPVRWPAGYLELAEGPDGAPIRRMGTPSALELRPDRGDLADPVGEGSLEAAPHVVRKHQDRALLLVTARCHFYCRFCFRPSFPDGSHDDPTRAELDAALRYLAGEVDVREVILSGGDPLVLPDERLAEILDAVSRMAHVERIRIHSRAPVTEPSRVTAALVERLGAGKPVRLVTHANHPIELGAPTRAAVATLLSGGVEVLNQGVLLRDVNDDPAVLEELVRSLVDAGAVPYYLHHPDRAPGNASFRVSIRRGLGIWRELVSRAPGLPLPRYVIDVPDGSGKVPVEALVDLGGGRWRAPSGHELDDIPDDPDQPPARFAG